MLLQNFKSMKQSKALSKLCKLCHFKMTGRSCTDEVRVKVPSFQKVTLLLWYEILIRYIVHLCFNWFEVFNNSSDIRWKESKVLWQFDSMFLFYVKMETDTQWLNQRVLALRMKFAYKLCIALYSLWYAAHHWIIQRLLIMKRWHCSN